MTYPVETIEYRGHTIEIYNDSDPQNPWEEWDGNPPMIVVYDNRFSSHKTYGHLDFDYLPELTHDEIKNNLKAVTDEFENPYLLTGVRDYMNSSNDVVEAVNAGLTDWYSDCNNSDKLEMQSRIYTMKGIKNICVTRTGYGQGDSVDLLIVATPEWMKEVGRHTMFPDELKASADLYAAYAFSNVYGYGMPDLNIACYGFYGSDHEKSGLMEYACNSIDSDIKRRRDLHTQQLKAWIKNHVPLNKRQPLGI